jgi:hypothetical protein
MQASIFQYAMWPSYPDLRPWSASTASSSKNRHSHTLSFPLPYPLSSPFTLRQSATLRGFASEKKALLSAEVLPIQRRASTTRIAPILQIYIPFSNHSPRIPIALQQKPSKRNVPPTHLTIYSPAALRTRSGSSLPPAIHLVMGNLGTIR